MTLVRPVPGNPAATYSALDDMCTSIEQLQASLEERITAEQATRGSADDALQTAITALQAEIDLRITAEQKTRYANDYAESVQRGKDDIAEAAAREKGDAAERVDRIAALQELSDQLDTLKADLVAERDRAASVQALAQLAATVDARRTEFVRAPQRPGELPVAFALVSSLYALAGDGDALPTVPSSYVRGGDNGSVVHLFGAGVLATLRPVAVEPGRAYRARIVIERRADPADPAGSSVQAGLVFLDQGYNVIPIGSGGIVYLDEMPGMRARDGRQERQAVISRAPGDTISIVAPPRARYARVFVRTFGADGDTDIEVLDLRDISEASVSDPVSADALARLTTIEAGNYGPRLAALESEVGTPSSLTFRTKSDAAAATIPESVEAVRLLGGAFLGDGRDGLYRRMPGAAPDGSDSFTSDGATFLRVTTAQDVFNAWFTPLFAAWFAGLPTTSPGTPDGQVARPFNNGGGVSFG